MVRGQGWSRRVGIGLGVVVAMTGFVLAVPAGAESTTVTYTANITIPVPPASNFAGSAGGDGWDVALTPTAVFNVFHHNETLELACHKQVDASKCWDTDSKTITDGQVGFTGTGHPGLYLDQATGKLYIYSTRTSDDTAGVVCVDTNQQPGSLFCGFTPLSAVGDGGITSAPMRVGSNLYAYNYVYGTTPSGGKGSTANTLLCFSLTSFAACTGQPFAVNVGSGTVYTGSSHPSPVTAAIAGKILVPTVIGREATSSVMGCFDTATGGSCAGSWPIALPSSYIGSNGAAFPLLNAGGTATGFCLPTGTDECFDLTGASVPTPAAMPSVIKATSPWNGPAVTLGARVYVPDGNDNEVACFNYATGAGCANFPKALTNADYMYTVNADPQRPACLWVNSDNGTAQIQNFDAFSGGACGQGAIRVLSASFVVPTPVCAPTAWRSLVMSTPPRSQYASGSVDFLDADASPIPGVATQALDGNGGVDLTSLPLTSSLPQFLITLNGLTGSLGQVIVTLTWDATFDPSCLSATVVAQAPPPATTAAPTTVAAPPVPGTLPSTGSSADGPLAAAALVLVVLGAGLMVVSVRFRADR